MRYGWYAQIQSLAEDNPILIEKIEQMNVWAFLRALAIRDAKIKYQNSLDEQ
jgi:hypothetical protein